MLLFYFYHILSYLIFPFSPIIFYFRIRAGKEDEKRVRERYGLPGCKRPSGRLVWIHAVSVGESSSTLPIIDVLMRKGYKILMTTSSMASVKFLSKKLPDGVIHQMYPIDCPIFIKRFLKYWQPEAVFFIESEIWPNAFYYANSYARIYIANFNIPEPAYNFWTGYALSLLRFSLNCCDKIFVPATDIMKKLYFIDQKKLFFANHTKYDAAYANSKIERPNWIMGIEKILKDKKIILFSSTHPGEDIIAIDAHRKLRTEFSNLLTIVVPRHLGRVDFLKINTKDFVTTVYPDNIIKADTEFIIVNTIGDLFSFYSICTVAVVCGSFVEGIGGHNPLEPASLSKPIITGPFNNSCKEICDNMLNANVLNYSNKKDIATDLIELLNDSNKLEEMSKNAKLFIENNCGGALYIVESAGL